MSLVVDESVDGLIVKRLREDGIEALYVAEMDPGISDDEVLDQANLRGAMLLTADKDFGELVFRQRRVSSGVVLLRLAGLSLSAKADLVSEMFAAHGEDLVNCFSVITPGSIRVRTQIFPHS